MFARRWLKNVFSKVAKQRKAQFRPSLEVLEDRHALAVNHPPVLTNPGPKLNNEGAVIRLPIRASDADKNALTFRAASLPDGLSINSRTGLITGKIGGQAARTTPYSVSLFVSDGKVTVKKVFKWTVKDITTPTITPIANRSSSEGTVVSLAVIGKDASGDKLTFTATGLPAGLTINRTTGVISGTIGGQAALASPFQVTVSASDRFHVGKTSFLWTVTDSTTPTFASIADQTHAEGTSPSLTVTATDGDGDTLTYSASNLPPGLTINSQTGAITGFLADGTAGTYAVVVTASDGFNTGSVNFQWTVSQFLSPGEFYDVNHDLSDGAEAEDTDTPNHSQATATYLGAASGNDEESSRTFTGHILSDSHAHSPALAQFNSTTGSAPDYWYVHATGGLFSVNDYSVTITTTGGSAASVYRLSVITDEGTQSINVSGSGSVTLNSGASSYSDDTDIFFKIEKVSGLPIQEAVTYTVTFHL